MQSQLTIRLPSDLEEGIATLAKRLRLKRSDIVRMALERFWQEFQSRDEIKPYDKVKNLIGKIKSGVSDLGSSHRKYLIKRFKKLA